MSKKKNSKKNSGSSSKKSGKKSKLPSPSNASLASRKVSKTSYHNAKKGQLAEERGLPNDKKEWTNAELDRLLDAFLVLECVYLSRRECFHSLFGRSPQSIHSMLWKLFINYDRPIIRSYSPADRKKNRRHLPFTPRDYAVIEQATSPMGRTNLAHSSVRLAQLLGRSLGETDSEMLRIYEESRRHTLFSPPIKIKDDEIERVIATVHEALKGAYDDLSKRIGL